jgi:hypothetical protein
MPRGHGIPSTTRGAPCADGRHYRHWSGTARLKDPRRPALLMHACIVVSLMAGVRPEEARAIGWEQDVDLDGTPPSVAVLRADRPGRHRDAEVPPRAEAGAAGCRGAQGVAGGRGGRAGGCRIALAGKLSIGRGLSEIDLSSYTRFKELDLGRAEPVEQPTVCLDRLHGIESDCANRPI